MKAKFINEKYVPGNAHRDVSQTSPYQTKKLNIPNFKHVPQDRDSRSISGEDDAGINPQNYSEENIDVTKIIKFLKDNTYGIATRGNEVYDVQKVIKYLKRYER
jgi:hypothetical protein